ncbi:MAG: bifunctional lytic transglycosylase/C40 family peptidase [Actinomycetota bacterium]|nr:bifunctional lytic transglycosylase/C40 family peptidase [Actinomycetota bacterium]
MKGACATFAGVWLTGTATAVALPVLLVSALVPGVGSATAGPASASAVADIPQFLLSHYQASPACAGLPWQVVAAVGWVESRHARVRLDPITNEWRGVDPRTGDTEAPILGPALDGSARTRAIPATRESTAYTGDPRWDHAIGPMQFLTSTFRAWALDGSGDGVTDPHNAFDAIATAGRYLCNGSSRLDSLDAALRRYNNSAAYVAAVQDKALAYGMAPGAGSPSGGDVGPAVKDLLLGVDVAPVLEFALAQLGKPYVWGAVGPGSYDCSGLTQAAYAAGGVRIPRTTAQQFHIGVPVDWRRQALRPGDLVFTPSGDKPLGHVGLVLDAGHWIVAPHTGDVVKIAPIPAGAIGAVRRVIGP